MTKEITTEINYEGVEQMPLKRFTEDAYLNYSMYVIMDRALPFIGDGLKPVQRRIIYSMSELGLNPKAKFMKSARTVGDVLGKYHPHGDTACYDSMVLMAQSESFRYPLVDGKGNWGSIENKAAHYRYTEAKLSPLSELLLSELGEDTADYQTNFDNTRKEPKFLPARLPHILLNGSMGIAVGMATDIPPHNINELAEGCLMLLDNPNATVADLMTAIPAPDYPTNAEIISPQSDIQRVYEQGRGSIRMRAVWRSEKDKIIITALPYKISSEKVFAEIAQLITDKKLPMISNVVDKSKRHNTHIEIELRRTKPQMSHEELMNYLFAKTKSLECNLKVNMNMIGLNGKPEVKSLAVILSEWLAFRHTTVTRRLTYRLNKILDRLHILEGLWIAFLNIDEVIEIIRNEDEPKPALIARFGLSEVQAEAILNLRLRHLAKLEEYQLKAEESELQKERDELQGILGSEKRLKNLIKKEIQADAKQFASPRQSPVVEREVAKVSEEVDFTPVRDVTVILSEKGWVRCATGHDIDVEKLAFRSGDKYLTHVCGKSNQLAIFIDSTGRAYAVDVNTLPNAKSHGEPITNKISVPDGANIVQLLMGDNAQKVLMASDAGYGFICRLEDLISRNKAGKAVLSLPENANMLPPQLLVGDDLETLSLVAMSSSGRMLVFPLSELPELSKGKGNKIIDLAKEGDHLARLFIIRPTSKLILKMGRRQNTLLPDAIDKYRGKRTRKGAELVRGITPDLVIQVVD